MEVVIGETSGLRQVLGQVRRVAPTDTAVLIAGETGTGKELIAEAVHRLSARGDQRLIKVNCAALPKGLVESELFGHERGAFTGASQQRQGRFELANGGTLFLDEVGELALETQAKLLRVLQEQAFERVGGSQTLRVNARIIGATNQNLERMVNGGTFRADLFYRLGVFPIDVPPLRERRGDIPPLVKYFIGRFAQAMAKPLRGVSEAAMTRLLRHQWPGNVRELRNVIERAAILAQDGLIGVDDLPSGRLPGAGQGATATLEDIKRRHIRRVLRQTGGVIHGPRGAAVILDVHPNTLRSYMLKLGIAKHYQQV